MKHILKYSPWVVALILGSLWLSQCDRHSTEVGSLKDILTEKDAVIIQVTTRTGHETFQKKALQAKYQKLYSNYGELKKVTNDLGIKNKQLKSYISIQSRTSWSGVAEVRVDTLLITDTDTLTIRDGIKIRDNWFEFDGGYHEGQFQYTYSYFDSLNIVTAWHRKGLFKPKELKVNVINYNPHTSILGLRSLSLSPKKAVLSIGPSIGYGIGSNGLTWHIGLTIQHPMITL